MADEITLTEDAAIPTTEPDNAAAKKGKKAPAKKTKDDGQPMPATLPDSITLASPYGYYDDAGTLHMWQEGQVVADADQIEDLLERGALLKDA